MARALSVASGSVVEQRVLRRNAAVWHRCTVFATGHLRLGLRSLYILERCGARKLTWGPDFLSVIHGGGCS